MLAAGSLHSKALNSSSRPLVLLICTAVVSVPSSSKLQAQRHQSMQQCMCWLPAADAATYLQLSSTALHSQQCTIRGQPGICYGRSLPCIEAPHTIVARPAAGSDSAAPDQQQTVADAVMDDGIC